MDLMEGVGKLLAHADTPGSVSEGLKSVFERLKEEAAAHAKGTCGCTEEHDCTGSMVLDLLNRLSQRSDPFYEEMPMLEREQVCSMAHTAAKLVEL